MTKKSKSGIEDALGIASASELQAALSLLNSKDIDDDEEDERSDISTDDIKLALNDAKNMKMQLRHIPDILEKENEIDVIANDAAKYFEDIMDKAFNTEDRFAPELFNAANSLLKTALDGKTAIINAKLKLLDLELKKRKLELSVNPGQSSGEQVINGEQVIVTDRNSLLRKHNK